MQKEFGKIKNWFLSHTDKDSLSSLLDPLVFWRRVVMLFFTGLIFSLILHGLIYLGIRSNLQSIAPAKSKVSEKFIDDKLLSLVMTEIKTKQENFNRLLGEKPAVIDPSL